MEAVYIKKLIQLVIKDDNGKEIGVCQLFIEGETCTIFGLNGPKTLEYICTQKEQVKEQTGCTQIKASCEMFMVKLLEKYAKEQYRLSIGRKFNKYGKEFCEILIEYD